MNILDKTRFGGNSVLRSDSAGLCKWFERIPRKTIELKPKLRKIHDSIDHDNELAMLIAEHVFGREIINES